MHKLRALLQRAVVATDLIVALNLIAATTAGAADSPKLAEVVVTATRTRQSADETTTSISVIDQAEIQQRNEALLSQSVLGVPGVDVIQFGSPGQTSFVSIRGAAPDQVLILLDGVEVNTPTVGQFDFADLTPDNVDHVEVVRGGGGTLHGAGAIGGVVNVLSQRGAGPFQIKADAEGGSAATHRERVQLQGAHGPLSISGSTSFFGSDGFRPYNDDYRNFSTAWRGDVDVLPQATLRAIARYSNTRSGLVNFNVADGVLDRDARRRDDFLLLKAEWEHLVAGGWSYRVATSYVQDNLRYRDDGPDPEDPQEIVPLVLAHLPSAIIAADAQVNYSLRDWSTTTLGLDFKERSVRVFKAFFEEEIDDGGAVEVERETEQFGANRSNIGAYAQEQVQLLDGRLRGVGGVRYDKYDGFGDRATWSGSAAYHVVASDTRVRVGYAEGFRVPTFDELFELTGNPQLEAETSWEINAGLTQDFWGGRMRLEPTYFYRHVHNLIEEVVDQLPGPIAPPAEEEGDGVLARNLSARFQGVELAARAEPLAWLALNANYTYLSFITPTGTLLNRPRHRAAATVAVHRDHLWQGEDRASAALQLFAVGRRDSADPGDDFESEQIAGHARLDLHLRYDFGGDWTAWSLTADVRNLLNRNYAESIGFRAPPASFLAGVRYRG